MMDDFIIDGDDNRHLYGDPFGCESYGCNIKKDGVSCVTKTAAVTAKKIIDAATLVEWNKSKPVLVDVEDRNEYFYVLVKKRLV